MKFKSRCVLFDLDGTLVDTAPDLGYAANCVRGELGLPPLPLAHYRPVASGGARGLLRAALDIAPDHPDFPARRDSFLSHYRTHLSRESRLFLGMAELLSRLEHKGVSWGVVTNKPAWLTRPLMDDLALSLRAVCIVSADDVPRPKPAPDSLLLACEQAQLQPQDCVYVGDDRRDVEASRAAGMRVIAAAWGYIGENESPDTWHADTVVATPEELYGLLA